jgi:hypothetical protein
MYASYLRSAPILLRRRIDLDLQQHRERKSYVQRPAPAPQPLPDSGISSVVATSLIGRALFSDLDDFSEDTRYSKLVSHGVLRSGQTQAAIRADSTATAASSVPAYQAPFPIHFDGPGMTDVLRDILMADDVASPSSAASAAAALSPKDAPPSPGAGSHSRDAEAVDTDSGDEVSASVSRKPSGAISAAAGAGGVPGQGLLEALSLSSRGAMVDINFGEMDTEVGEFTTVSRRSGAGSVGNASLTDYHCSGQPEGRGARPFPAPARARHQAERRRAGFRGGGCGSAGTRAFTDAVSHAAQCLHYKYDGGYQRPFCTIIRFVRWRRSGQTILRPCRS